MSKREQAIRNWAPLGDRPVAVLSEGRGGVGLVLRLVAHGDAFLGLVPAHAQLAERIRMGLAPAVAFALEGGGRLLADARVTLRGRADADEMWRSSHEPFGVADALVIEVAPLELWPDGDDDEPRGACPRT